MIIEIADIKVNPGTEKDFEAAVAEAVPLFKRAQGCHAMRLERSIEFPSRFLLVVDWETLEDHTVRFRNSEDFQSWRKLVGSYFAEPPAVQHVRTALAGF